MESSKHLRLAGTAFAAIDNALRDNSSYKSFRQGTLNVVEYQKWVESKALSGSFHLNEDQMNLSARFPPDLHHFLRQKMSQCRAMDILPDDRYDENTLENNLSRIWCGYDHKGYMTYIFPEESALLYGIVCSIRPRHAVFMGSYYGYWAAAAKAACPEMATTLLDIDEKVMDVARQNFENLGLSCSTTYGIGDAEELVGRINNIDLLVLDAEGPKSEAVPEDYRDKAIYYPHLRAALSKMEKGAVMIAHNVILSNFTSGDYFDRRQKYYRSQYIKFLRLIRENFVYTVVDSTEGVLVARKA